MRAVPVSSTRSTTAAQDRPAPPVAGRERVEVRRERHLGLRADLQRGSGRGMRAPRVGGRFLDVQLAHVQRFAGSRQDDAGQQARCLGLSGIECAGRDVTHARLLSSSASGAPSIRCGARVLSYMFSALAMAMCMSRYW